MTKRQAKEAIEKLSAKIKKHNRLYHSFDQPEISDFEYDQLFQQLIDLESQYPELIKHDSPTQTVGGEVLDFFDKMQHREPMLSLQNTYSAEEIVEFEMKIQRQLNNDESLEFFCSPKFDGVAMELVYKDGNLFSAITRGDGSVGENVISNVKTIDNVPHSLQTQNPPSQIDIRGEVLLFKKEFLRINTEQEENGLQTFANPRNAAAGTIRQLDSRIAKGRGLKMFCYSLGFHEGITFNSQLEFESKLNAWGLPVMQLCKTSPTTKSLAAICKGAKEVIAYYEAIQKIRHNLDFEIDGIVVKINSFPLQKSLGNIARSPRWAFAAKFSPEQAQTIIKDIHVQVGRTGALTPVAIMEPVAVGGVTISHATLHNQSEIQRKDIRKGDTVIIHRAGDVIPEIVSVVLEKRSKNSVPFQIPDQCPSCGENAVQMEGEIVKRCLNPVCSSKLIESLKHFVSRNAMNIDKLGSKQIELFFKNQLIQRFSDIYRLSYDSIINLKRQGDLSTRNLLESIEKSKTTELHRLIYALGIRFVGEQTARTLAQHFKTMENFLTATEEELLDLPDIGPKVTQSIIAALGQKYFQEEVKRLLSLGLVPKPINSTKNRLNAQINGKSFVVTGTLPIPRSEAQEIIRQAGGIINSAISKNTTVLIAGEKAGSKLDKAQKLGIEIWTWADLKNKLG